MRPTLQRMRIAAKVVKGFKSLAFILKKCTAICSITFSLRIRQSFLLGLARKRSEVSKQKLSIHDAFSVQNFWMYVQYFWTAVQCFWMCVQCFWTKISSSIIYFFFVASPNGWANTETIAWLMIHRLISKRILRWTKHHSVNLLRMNRRVEEKASFNEFVAPEQIRHGI